MTYRRLFTLPGSLLACLVLCTAQTCPTTTDADQDGFSSEEDCNDSNAAIYPGAPEVCDGQDQDCDGQVDEDFPVETWYYDRDSDGYGDIASPVTGCVKPDGTQSQVGDCNDLNMAVYPGAKEVCNHQDDNCDGQVDEGLHCTTDHDWDGSNSDVDCDDQDPAVGAGLLELCGDGKDNDCDGQADERECQVDERPISRLADGEYYQSVSGSGGATVYTLSFWIDAQVNNLAYTKDVWLEISPDAYDLSLAKRYNLVYEVPLTSPFERWGVDITTGCAYSTGPQPQAYHCLEDGNYATHEVWAYRLGYTVNGKTYYDDNGGRGYPLYHADAQAP